MNNTINAWQQQSNDSIFSCILDDTILGSNKNNTNNIDNDNDVLSKETIDQLIAVGLKYKKKYKNLTKELSNLSKQYDELKNLNSVYENKNKNIINLLQEQEIQLNQNYINDISILKEENNINIERLRSELLAEQNKALGYKQKYDSIDASRKKDNTEREELINHNLSLVKEIEVLKRDFEVEKMNLLLSRDQISDSERTGLLRRALIAEEKIERFKDTIDSELVAKLTSELNVSRQRIQELELSQRDCDAMLKLAREELLNMNNEMVNMIECKSRVEEATRLVLEENKILREKS